nr:MAG TPA: hypothetical protein [Caudoviricetes sp.]
MSLLYSSLAFFSFLSSVSLMSSTISPIFFSTALLKRSLSSAELMKIVLLSTTPICLSHFLI